MRARNFVPSAIAFGLLLLPVAQAQSPGRPDPLNPEAKVPPLEHRSALARYRPAGDVTVGDWKAANETVNRIGGWRAYAREAAAPEPPAAAASAAAPASPVSPASPADPANPPAPPRPASAGGGHLHHGGGTR